MQSAKRIWRAVFLVIPLLCAANVFAETVDDYTPEVTARVARIGFLRGEAQIRRADVQNWERATQNLPIVEGDEITTDQTRVWKFNLTAHISASFGKRLFENRRLARRRHRRQSAAGV
jgi:hypothetical protein